MGEFTQAFECAGVVLVAQRGSSMTAPGWQVGNMWLGRAYTITPATLHYSNILRSDMNLVCFYLTYTCIKLWNVD